MLQLFDTAYRLIEKCEFIIIKIMRYISIICVLLVFISLNAQELTVTQHLEDFDLVVQQVEGNYAGFSSKVTNATDSSYQAHKADLRNQVELGKRDGADAAAEYVAWFADNHLYMFNNGYNMSQQYLPARKELTDHLNMDYHPKKLADKVTDKTFLIRFPSCQGYDPNMEWIEESIKLYLQSGCANLIIDLRGNSGGQDQFYEPYLKLLYDHPGLTEGAEFYNTVENREAFEQLSQMNGNPEWLESRLKKCRESANGSFVLFGDSLITIEYDSIYEKPIKAAIIIDKYVMSSGEQMLLEVQATSNRVTIYGRDNTMGCLDFSNVRPAAELPNGKGTLAIPTTRSCRLSNKGIDETGIQPDVRITLPLPQSLSDNLDDWVIWVAAELEK